MLKNIPSEDETAIYKSSFTANRKIYGDISILDVHTNLCSVLCVVSFNRLLSYDSNVFTEDMERS